MRSALLHKRCIRLLVPREGLIWVWVLTAPMLRWTQKQKRMLSKLTTKSLKRLNDRSCSHQATSFAILSNVAAFHLAMAPDGVLFATAPTLSTRDAVYAIDPHGEVSIVCRTFGRPQGMGVDAHGALHVVEALAGASGLYRLIADGETEQVVAASSLVGVAFDDAGGAVVVSGDTAYRFDRLPRSSHAA